MSKKCNPYKNKTLEWKKSKKFISRTFHFTIETPKIRDLKNIDLLKNFLFVMNWIFMRRQKHLHGIQEGIKFK